MRYALRAPRGGRVTRHHALRIPTGGRRYAVHAARAHGGARYAVPCVTHPHEGGGVTRYGTGPRGARYALRCGTRYGTHGGGSLRGTLRSRYGTHGGGSLRGTLRSRYGTHGGGSLRGTRYDAVRWSQPRGGGGKHARSSIARSLARAARGGTGPLGAWAWGTHGGVAWAWRRTCYHGRGTRYGGNHQVSSGIHGIQGGRFTVASGGDLRGCT